MEEPASLVENTRHSGESGRISATRHSGGHFWLVATFGWWPLLAGGGPLSCSLAGGSLLSRGGSARNRQLPPHCSATQHGCGSGGRGGGGEG